MILVWNDDIDEYKNFLYGINYEINDFSDYCKIFEIDDERVDILDNNDIAIKNIPREYIRMTGYGKIVVNKKILENYKTDHLLYYLQR